MLRRQEDRDRTVVFVDVGSRFTTVVFGKADQINFVKKIPIGTLRFNEEISSRLGISLDEAEKLRQAVRKQKAGWENGIVQEHMPPELDASSRQAIVDAISGVAEELARELALCLRYYTVSFRGKRVERAFFTGGGAYETILLNVLKRQLHVEIEVAQPLKGFDLSGQDAGVNLGGDRRGLLCEWAVAVGLGLKGSTGSRAEDLEQL
jgi:Tfp pilus assembly PilM family ATPase